MRREWIEIVPAVSSIRELDTSPSMRREWIEILLLQHTARSIVVSLHAEGVD